MNWEVVNDNDQAKIKVIGVGGAGGNAVIHMMNHKKTIKLLSCKNF